VNWMDSQWPVRVRCGARKASSEPSRHSGFTLIELLVVIAIIGILAGLIIPAVARAKLQAKITSARTDMKSIEGAVVSYQSTYTLAPVPKAIAEGGKDYSFDTGNGDVMVILMAATNLAANAGHARNPQRQAFLNAQTKEGTAPGKISTPSYDFQDQWGNPYVIAFDLNYDNIVDVEDAAYPYKGIHKPVIIWSKGPDGKAGTPADNKDNIKSWE
jgi:prepilin-type N-terminal cleavage/methylation domain-containing protein